MDLNLFRRHSEDCPGAARGRTYTKCKCPVWVDGRVDGVRVLRSMKTRDWERAERRMLSQSDPGSPVLKRRPPSEAVEAFVADCEARHLARSTVIGYKNLLGALSKFCEGASVKYTDQIDLDALTNFRASRLGRDGKSPMMASSQRKELEGLRHFCKFCEQREWMKSNPAAILKPPKEDRRPTLPFEPEEIEAILKACDLIDNNNKPSALRARVRSRALLLVLLYAGLRISDAAVLERASLDPKTGKLLLRTMKTGSALYVKLHQSAIDALKALPAESAKYFFWSGQGSVWSVIGSLRRTVEAVLKLAKVKGHPHRFRDTFAVELLQKDVPIRTVQLLLGHGSVQTTEKHYAPFVKSTQRLLDDAVAKLDFSGGAKLPEKGVKNRRGNS